MRLRELVYQSPHHPIAAWVGDGGANAKLELATAHRTLAERIVDDLRPETEATFGPGSAVPRTCGLDPAGRGDPARCRGQRDEA